ncbi:UVR8 [Symbiodinium sp. CCMP2592]|nr:UVR8 [Symbiodinium sp. CCMP2592]
MAAVKVLALLSAVCILTAVAEEVAKLALGHSLSCALGSQGSIKCWGDNGNGQLGQGDDVRRGDGANEMGKFLPTIDLGTGRHALEVNSGAFHNCARLDDGLVKCWGRGTKGQLGIGDTEHRGDNSDEMGQFLPTVELGTGRTAVRLGLGYEFGCAVLDDGSLKCWGEGVHGQLGLGTSANMGDGSSEMGDHLPAVDLGTGRTAAEVTAGFYFTCARLDDSSVKCWGSNGFGQIGDGSSGTYVGDASGEMGDNLPTVDLGTGRTAVELSAGGYHVCARLDNGSVKCWGRNHKYQLGLGLDTSTRIGDESNEMGDYLPPVDLGTGRTAAEVSSGYFHTCARLDDGAIRCWGPNDYGEIGHTATLPSNVDLGTGRTAVHVAANGYSTCALLDNLETKCWGQNDDGTLGLGDTQDRGKSSSDMGNSLPAVDILKQHIHAHRDNHHEHLNHERQHIQQHGHKPNNEQQLRFQNQQFDNHLDEHLNHERQHIQQHGHKPNNDQQFRLQNQQFDNHPDEHLNHKRLINRNDECLGEESRSVLSGYTLQGSATSSTAATDDAREVMRKQEAEAAVKEAEAATEAASQRLVAVQDLLNSLNNTGDNGVMGEVVDTTEAGAVKVVAYDVEALTSSGQNATVSMENSSIGAEVPGDVLAQAQALVGDGPVLLGVVSLSEDLAKKFSNPPADRGPGEGQSASMFAARARMHHPDALRGPKAPILRSSPVVVEVRNKNGGIVDLGKLQSPMVVQLEVSHDNDTVKCAYWNETEAVWETDGLACSVAKRVGWVSSGVWTSWRPAAVKLPPGPRTDLVPGQELENVLKCSSLFEVLTAEGIAKLARSGRVELVARKSERTTDNNNNNRLVRVSPFQTWMASANTDSDLPVLPAAAAGLVTSSRKASS